MKLFIFKDVEIRVEKPACGRSLKHNKNMALKGYLKITIKKAPFGHREIFDYWSGEPIPYAPTKSIELLAVREILNDAMRAHSITEKEYVETYCVPLTYDDLVRAQNVYKKSKKSLKKMIKLFTTLDDVRALRDAVDLAVSKT